VANGIRSAFEIGTNTGLNLDALRILLPGAQLAGIEINGKAHAAAPAKHADVVLGPAQDIKVDEKFDLVLTCGMLVHINPDDLPTIYDKMVALSARYILLVEYYNPTPVTIP
jgi:hypothetical protein